MAKRIFSVFTKPWKTETPEELAALVSKLGFDAVEFPLRPGFQVEPRDAEKGLPALRDCFAGYNLRIASVASVPEEPIFAACAAAGVPVIRIMLQNRAGSYLAAESDWKRELSGYVPLCEKYGVRVAVQQHQGNGVFSTMELRRALEGFDRRYIRGIWDAAHSALAGERPEKALDIAWDCLEMVNFKNAFWRRTNGPEATRAEYAPYFTTGPEGAGDWKAAADVLNARGYEGVICMPAEYTDARGTNDYIARDLLYLKSLLG